MKNNGLLPLSKEQNIVYMGGFAKKPHVIWNQEREAAGLDQVESHDLTAALDVGIEAVKLLIQADRANQN